MFFAQKFAAMIPLNFNIYLTLIFYPIHTALDLTLTYHTRLQLDLKFIFPTLRTLFTSSKGESTRSRRIFARQLLAKCNANNREVTNSNRGEAT